MKPRCSKWSIWYGKECEGRLGRGRLTLFVRKNFTKKDETLFLRFRRVWFTADFTDTRVINLALKQGLHVCLEVTPKTIKKFSKRLLNRCQIYLKLTDMFPLKTDDCIKIGPSFSETVVTVLISPSNPKDYFRDVKIK